jgi:hypothetical protein
MAFDDLSRRMKPASSRASQLVSGILLVVLRVASLGMMAL